MLHLYMARLGLKKYCLQHHDRQNKLTKVKLTGKSLNTEQTHLEDEKQPQDDMKCHSETKSSSIDVSHIWDHDLRSEEIQKR